MIVSLTMAILHPAIVLSAHAEGSRSIPLGGGWIESPPGSVRFVLSGTEGRSNPLRKPLDEPYSGDELFVRYRLRYDATSIDAPPDDEGEFFVLWLDAVEGGDSATHSNGVPNFGIHVKETENRFMVRYAPRGEQFATKLEGDRDYFVVGRLWKTVSGEDRPFDHAELWIDPSDDAAAKPDASARVEKAVSTVRWIGFSTGGKTEFDDRIEVWDIALATTWEGILGLPPKPTEPPPPPERTISFTKQIYPLLKDRCFECHSGEDATEGVRLDVLDEVLNQTTPHNADASRLIELVANAEMPPDSDPLAEDEVALLRTWIDEGLEWDEALLPTPVPQSNHWAFQPIRRPVVPRVQSADWVRNPIDAFIARRHEELGLRPASEADETTLARRISLDLTGLPPATGLSDLSIDQWLASPAYGVRWARHWLDVARWAESNGHQHNRNRPYAWRYRDWVVDAFNAGKTFDAFLREQIAGDELTPPRDENIIATGFLAAARYSGNELDKKIQRNDILVDVTNTTASAFLGLTLECAQCHTHKFDPITIRDYYRFQAFFARAQPSNVVLGNETDRAAKLIDERWRLFDSVHARIVERKRRQGHPEPIYVIPKSVIAGMTSSERQRFHALESQIAALPQTWSYFSPLHPEADRRIAPHEMRWPLPRHASVLERLQPALLIRGDVNARGPEVEAGWPSLFGPMPAQVESPRRALAKWMTSRDNPLTARVWVNRVWQWHFGQGLVETSGDFGAQGAAPTHPNLLDYLASELIEADWDTRHIQRLILESATYRQSSSFSAANEQIDPDNRMLWRWTPRRLEAEAVRDSILAVSGQLDQTLGGASDRGPSQRRSLYRHQRRDNLPPQQMLFDGAQGIVPCSRRRVSTTALQPLWLLNSDFVQDAAARLAARSGTVEQAFRLVLSRPPTDEETAQLEELADEYGLESVCLALLNSSEFLYLP